jgi:nitroreductase
VDFISLAKKRCSVRGYTREPVSSALLDKVLEAGRLSPSAANKQARHFIVVRDENTRMELLDAFPREWFQQAPLVIVICTEPEKAWSRKDGKNYADVDGAIAVDHMTLCAADIGLGTCWIGAFDPDKVCQVLELPEGIEPLAMLTLGHAQDPGRQTGRKPLQELLHHEKW